MSQRSKKTGLGLITTMLVITATMLLAGCPLSEPHTPTDEVPSFECGQEALYAFTHDGCEPMSAVGEGACRCVLGYVWDGADCSMLGGCECVGADCDSLTESYEECIENHNACVAETPVYECGSMALFSLSHDRCESMDAAGEGACQCVLGYVWDGDDCVSIGGCECVGSDCDSLTESYEECIENHDACVEETHVIECGSVELFSLSHDRCAPMDAAGEGGCRCALGYTWDGDDCVFIGGCECVGSDCDSLTETYEECIGNHDACLPERPVEPVEPELTPCGEDLFCDAETEVCRISLAWLYSYECVPVPEACEDDRSCDCFGNSLCNDSCDVCVDEPAENTVTCECTCC